MQRTKIEEKIQEEIRRRAFVRADLQRQDRRHFRATSLTIEALEEITGLPRSELEQIAEEVRASFKKKRKDYFSIKSQFIMVLALSVALVLLIYGLIRWIL